MRLFALPAAFFRKKRRPDPFCPNRNLLLRRFFIIALCMQIAMAVTAQQITLSVKNQTVPYVLNEIRKQTGFSIFYNDAMFKNAKPITVEASGMPMEKLLQLCLKDLPLSFAVISNTVVIKDQKPASAKPNNTGKSVQTETISGTITNENGEPVEGASVSEKDAGNTTVSDSKGFFTIKLKSANAVLVVSHTSYQTREIQADAKLAMKVVLPVATNALEEVVVVGYGEMKKRDLTGAVSSVNEKQLKDVPITSAAQALAGRLAGVQITTSEGGAGASSTIRVRGGGSITQDNSPLYVIDGIQVEDGLSSIAPTDIASIDVLKDAATTAIYGARGANGVVIITTKGGKAMKTQVNYNAHIDKSVLARKLSVLHPYDFLVYQYERSRGSISDSTSFSNNYGTTFDTLSVYKALPFEDWQQLVLGLNGLAQTHNVSVTGGDKKTQFNLSYTYNDQKEIVINSRYNRHILNFRFDHTANDWLKLGLNARYNSSRVMGAGLSNPGVGTFNSLRNVIKYRPFLFNGVAGDELDAEYFAETNAAGNNLGVLNPIQLNNAQYRSNSTNLVNLNGYINLTLSQKISFKTTLGIDRNQQSRQSFDDYITPNARINGGGQPMAGVNDIGINTFNLSNVFTFKNLFFRSSKHNLTALLGNEFYTIHADGLNSQFRLYPIGTEPENALNQPNLGQPVLTYPQATKYASKLVSFFGRLNYNFEKKYLFQFTLRSDASSKFADGNRVGYYPSASFAWRLSDEQFMQKLNGISDLKLRLSYGTSGNCRIDDYLFQTVFNANAIYALNDNINVIGLTPSYLSNPLLRWETTVSRNIGLDFSILHNRLNVTIDAYRNTTKDLLINVPIPTSSGYTTQYRNVGQTRNEGVELQLGATIAKNKAFSWSANFNVAYNKNKVVALAPGQNEYYQNSGWGIASQPADFIIQVGQAVGSVYGYESEGFYTLNDFDYNTANSQYTLKKGLADPSTLQGVAQPGLIKFRDVDGDGFITSDDRKILGTTNPPVTGGLNQQFTYNNFDLSVFCNFQLGGKVLNANRIEFTNSYTANTNLLGETAGRWRTIDEKGNRMQWTVVPTGSTQRVAIGAPPEQLATINANASTYMPVTGTAAFYVRSDAVERGDFLRLNNVTMGYTFKAAFLKRMSVSRFRMYATLNNVALLTGYSGYDPDVNTRRTTPTTPGVDYSAYPRSRTYVFGLQVGF